MSVFFFYFLSALALLSAVSVIFQKNPVYSALSLIVVFFSIAGFFLMQGAFYLAVLEILVYAGAIMVLFLFVVMLLKTGEDTMLYLPSVAKMGTIFVFISVLAGLFGVYLNEHISSSFAGKFGVMFGQDFEMLHAGGVADLGGALFTKYLFPFEIASVLLLVAMVGAIFITKREKKT
ncbi:MAG: NADH-quinone oxidoreductase subunit J [Candidatus Marinimicrobia bacterium]|nr:NADH-quinone oxidoreductase subunit J [Candidatus Neomarinimicrobiota bacterium]